MLLSISPSLFPAFLSTWEQPSSVLVMLHLRRYHTASVGHWEMLTEGVQEQSKCGSILSHVLEIHQFKYSQQAKTVLGGGFFHEIVEFNFEPIHPFSVNDIPCHWTPQSVWKRHSVRNGKVLFCFFQTIHDFADLYRNISHLPHLQTEEPMQPLPEHKTFLFTDYSYSFTLWLL